MTNLFGIRGVLLIGGSVPSYILEYVTFDQASITLASKKAWSVGAKSVIVVSELKNRLTSLYRESLRIFVKVDNDGVCSIISTKFGNLGCADGVITLSITWTKSQI